VTLEHKVFKETQVFKDQQEKQVQEVIKASKEILDLLVLQGLKVQQEV
jgi:hypothetical protein